MVTARTIDLMQKAARTLTGENVVIRFERPDYKRADGMTWRDMSGAVRVDVSPELKAYPAHLLDVFLHELAHAKLHAPGYAKQAKAPPASIARSCTDVLAAAAMARQETEADELADVWKAYAAVTWQNCQEATKLDSQLRTLTYYTGE